MNASNKTNYCELVGRDGEPTEMHRSHGNGRPLGLVFESETLAQKYAQIHDFSRDIRVRELSPLDLPRDKSHERRCLVVTRVEEQECHYRELTLDVLQARESAGVEKGPQLLPTPRSEDGIDIWNDEQRYELLCDAMDRSELLVPKYFAMNLLFRGQERFGAFVKSVSEDRQRLERLLFEKDIPRLLRCQPEDNPVQLQEMQIYSAVRDICRGRLWNSVEEGRDFSEKELATVLFKNWEEASGKKDMKALIRTECYENLRIASDNGHSEAITARVFLNDRMYYQRSICSVARRTWTLIDTFNHPVFTKRDAAASYEQADRRQVIVLFPVCDHWNFFDGKPIPRMTKYLGKLKALFLELDVDFEIHSPRIGHKNWTKRGIT